MPAQKFSYKNTIVGKNVRACDNHTQARYKTRATLQCGMALKITIGNVQASVTIRVDISLK